MNMHRENVLIQSKESSWGFWDWSWQHNLTDREDNEHLKHVCMRTNLVIEPDTAWQGIRSCIEYYAGHPLKGTFGTHYSKPISLFRLIVTLSGWPPLTVLSADCLTATDITSLKTCLAYYRLVPLVGAVGHVSQTVTVDHPRYGAVSRLLKLHVNIPLARRSIFFVERHLVLDLSSCIHSCIDTQSQSWCLHKRLLEWCACTT
jgi:hypothetical protein